MAEEKVEAGGVEITVGEKTTGEKAAEAAPFYGNYLKTAEAASKTGEPGGDQALTSEASALIQSVGTSATSLTAELPLLLGLNFGGSQLVLGARAGAFADLNKSSNIWNKTHLMLGASVGYAIPLTPWLRVMPELNLRTMSSESDVMLLGSLGVIVGGYSTSS